MEGSEFRVVHVRRARRSDVWISLEGGKILFWSEPVAMDVCEGHHRNAGCRRRGPGGDQVGDHEGHEVARHHMHTVGFRHQPIW